MTNEEIIAYCLQKPTAYLDYPYGDEPACVRIRVEDRHPVFVQIWTSPSVRNVTVRTEPSMAEFYRAAYPNCIRRGYYCPPVMQPYWNTIAMDENWRSDVPDDVLFSMLDDAFDACVARLPKRLQKLIIQPSEEDKT